MSHLVKLIDEDSNYKSISLYNYLYKSNNIPEGWEDFFQLEDIKAEIQKISDYLWEEREYMIYPTIYRIFRIFYLIPLNKIKVWFQGQDPYAIPADVATGIAFDVRIGQPINPSLRNIYKEIGTPDHLQTGQLMNW